MSYNTNFEKLNEISCAQMHRQTHAGYDITLAEIIRETRLHLNMLNVTF